MDFRLILALAVLGFAGTVDASSCTHTDNLDRPRIGLVLGGGGARGISHIGVIRVLEELRVPVDYVAGTSMGSIVGGLYATGMTSDELESTVQSVDWTEIFKDSTARADRTFRRKRDDQLSLFGPKLGVGKDSSLLPRGAIAGQKIALLFEDVASSRVQVDHFDQLPIPFRAVATDIIDGEPVVIEDDDLALAMRSSMSIPGIFAPVTYGDHLLVDGGIAKNLPIDVVRGMGADVVIAIDVGSPLHSRDELGNLLQVTGQLSNILVQRNTMAQRALLREQDVLIVPNLGDKISSADFKKGEEAIGIGLQAGRDAMGELASLGLSEVDFKAHRAGIEACVSGVPIIEFVDLQNRSRFSNDVINKRINVELGKPLDAQQIDADLSQVYALGFIERATYQVVERDGRKGVSIQVDQDYRGTNFIETGFDLIETSGSTTVDVRAAYLKTDIDKYGTEFRGGAQVGQNQKLFAELYKPFGENLYYIALPRVKAQRIQVNTFDNNGAKIAQVEVMEVLGSLSLGRELGRSAAFFGGARRATGQLDVEVGPPTSHTSFERGEWFLNGTWDRLDDRFFPTTGQYVYLEHFFSRKNIDADVNFEQFRSKGFLVGTFREKHTLMGGLRYATTINGTAPVQNFVRAGGLFNMSGFEPNELTGQHYGQAMLGYRFRMKDRPLLPPHIGGTIEYGNATNDRDDIIDNGIWNGSLYLGFDSPIGPIYAGYGWREHDTGVVFLRIGTVFTSGLDE